MVVPKKKADTKFLRNGLILRVVMDVLELI